MKTKNKAYVASGGEKKKPKKQKKKPGQVR